MSAVLLTEIADELECAGMDEYAERLRFWDANSDQLGEHLAQARDALLALACAFYDESVLPRDFEADHLFDRGLLSQHRDITDEYQTNLTKAGEAFVREQLAAAPTTRGTD